MKRKLQIVLIFTLSLVWLILPQVTQAAQTSQITQFGITWTFDKEYEYGQFANGDYWVVGPVNITNVTPGWNGESHGSMINPMPIPRGKQAYDSRYGGFDSSLLVEAPVTLEPNTSLISAISWTDADKDDPDYPYEQGGVPRPFLRGAAVLTVVESIPPEGSFRPPYAGNNKPMYLTSNLRKDLLPNLTLVENTPDINDVAEDFERVWLDHFTHHGDGTQYSSPSENMPNYGREYSILVGKASLLLMLDEEELISRWGSDKDTLLIRFVQLGIDLYAVVENGGYWWSGGGLNHGRKWPILFAGLMLDHSGMKNIGARSQEMPYQGFQEDGQTFYVTQHPDGDQAPPGNTDYDIYVPPYHLQQYGGSGNNYETGAVKVTRGSTTVEGVGTSWASSSKVDAGYSFGVHNDVEAYKVDGKAYVIDRVIDDTHLTLTEAYRGNTDTSGKATYMINPNRVVYGHGNGGKDIDYVEYVAAHKDLPEWRGQPDYPNWYGLDWDVPYRAINGMSYPGLVLSALIMGQKETWNHDALFDYTDRWVAVHTEYYTGNPIHEGLYVYGGDFHKDMWLTYREDYGSVWTISPTLTITAVNGSVIKTPDKPAYNLGEIVTLEAIPDPGYEFVGWSGYLLDTGNPGKILMHAHQSVTANFAISNHEDDLDYGDKPDKTSMKCYNNVFNPTKEQEALIWIELSKPARVKVDLYNTRGNRIRELVDKEEDAGTCKYYWNGRDDSGNVVGSGLYFVHIQAGDFKKTKKIVVVK